MKRILIPILALLLGLAVAIGMFYHGAQDTPPATSGDAQQVETTAPNASENTQPTPETTAEAPSEDEAPAAPEAEAAKPKPDEAQPTDRKTYAGLHILPGSYNEWLELGSNDPNDGYRLKIVFNGYGAGIQRITLTDYDELKTEDSPPYPIIDLPLTKSPSWTPYAGKTLWIDGQPLDLQATKWQADDVVTLDAGASLSFRAVVVDADEKPVAEVVRTYHLSKQTEESPNRGYDIRVEQKIVNRSDTPLKVAYRQNAQINLARDSSSYLPDRDFVTGYFNPSYANRNQIFAEDSHRRHDDVIGAKQPDVWPNPEISANSELVWLATENRYFAVVTHPAVPLDLTTEHTSQVPVFTDIFSEVGLSVHDSEQPAPNNKAAVITLKTNTLTVEPGQDADLSFGIFAGPREPEVLSQAPFQALGFGGLIRYNIGGMCAFCTFQWLAHGLLWLLNFFHAVTFDWGVAIILLVAVVRLCLHPITKKAQINMMKMGKQMAALQPEMEKIKKKYKDDQQKLNAEMMKLYREKGVNPAGFLGCLPMLLQTPIWIALYAMLYFAIELRHEPAFYGVFQLISNGAWHFLEDLSVPDNFIRFVAPHEAAWTIPLPFINGIPLRGINVLPILMGIVFFINQKFTTPPPANEQQAQQQKIMKFMVLLFPVFLYGAPSGLTLYITTSTLAGIVDSYLVRKHIKEQEAAGTLFDRKPRKPGGLMDRMSRIMEQKQLEMQQKQLEMQNNKGGASGGYKKRKR